VKFVNHYECSCGCTWYDVWDCTCDDRCPECNTPCSPVESEDYVPEEKSTRKVPITLADLENHHREHTMLQGK
jgi:hypothetical protein